MLCHEHKFNPENRHPSQHRHDKGKMDMSECTLDWFHDLVDRHQELARTDAVYIFGVYENNEWTDHLVYYKNSN